MLRRSLLPLGLVPLIGVLAVALFVLLGTEKAQTAAVVDVPGGFQDQKVADAPGAIALAFTPDDRMLVTTKQGQVLVREEGASGTTEALDISGRVCSDRERGLLGVAVDPEFGTAGNSFVYLYYTYNESDVCPVQQPASNRNPVNRVSRFPMNGDKIDPTKEEVLVDNIPSPNGNHNGGDLHFGDAGHLYVSVGDGGCDYRTPDRCQTENDASRDQNVLLGKILRVNKDGTIPADNPNADAQNGVRCGTLTNNNARGGSAAAPDQVCKETYARGFRNPFRFAFDPDGGSATRPFVNDVGGSNWEEVNKGIPSADYGWNVREGRCKAGTSTDCGAPPAGMTNPIHAYNHNTGCSSITGGAFIPNATSWPASYEDSYLFGDYVCGKIFKLTPKDGGFTKTTFAGGLGQGGPVSMAFGSDGELYYTTFAGGGEVHRITYVPDNKAPTADLEADKTYGPTPLTVAFDGSGSSDPEGGALKHEWDFDYTEGNFEPDPNAAGSTASHTYDTEGGYTAALRVTDGGGFSDIAEVAVRPGDAAKPVPVIESVTPNGPFKVGEEITLTGSATDADDDNDDDPGTAPTLKWEVIRHHNNDHTHPYFDGTGENQSFTAPSPEGLDATDPAENYLEVRLTATDSQGLSETVSRRLEPKTVEVTFATRPIGLKLTANGKVFRAPRTLVSWEGYKLNVDAPAQRDAQGRYRVFRSWSDGGTRSHTITTPPDPQTYTATFVVR